MATVGGRWYTRVGCGMWFIDGFRKVWLDEFLTLRGGEVAASVCDISAIFKDVTLVDVSHCGESVCGTPRK